MYNLTKDLAYLIGVYMTDGYIQLDRKKEPSQLRLKSIDHEYIFNTSISSKNVCGNSGHILNRKEKSGFNKKKQEVLIVCNKELASYLKSLTGSKRWIPTFLEDCEEDIFKSFVCAVLDGDGFVGVKKGTYYSQLGISMADDWIDRFMYLLQKRGVKTHKRQIKNRQKPLRDLIHYNIDIKTFLEKGYYISIERKQKRLNDYKRFILDKYKI